MSGANLYHHLHRRIRVALGEVKLTDHNQDQVSHQNYGAEGQNQETHIHMRQLEHTLTYTDRSSLCVVDEKRLKNEIDQSKCVEEVPSKPWQVLSDEEVDRKC